MFAAVAAATWNAITAYEGTRPEVWPAREPRPRAAAPHVVDATGYRGGLRPAMAGAIVFAVAMVLVVPIAVMFGGAIWSALFGWFASDDATSAADGPAPDGD